MNKKRSFWKAALPIAAALVLVIGTIATGNQLSAQDSALPSTPKMAVTRSMDQSPSYASDAGYSESSDSAASYSNEMSASGADYGVLGPSPDTYAEISGDDLPSGTKLVRTADVTLVSSSFDSDSAAIRTLTSTVGGYVESMNQSGDKASGKNRVIYYHLRIPSDQLDGFLTGLEGIGRMTEHSESSEDMSTEYSDTSMRLKTQKDKLARLQQLMAQATDVSDLLEIENSIADTQYEIDRYESSLRTIDRDVDKSAVTVTLREETPAEVAQAKELTLGERIRNGFEASLKGLGEFLRNMLVFVVMCLPVLVPVAVISVILWLILRARKQRKLRKDDAEQAPDDKK